MTASENTSQLLRLPPELLHQVLRLVYPADLAILPRVCRELNVFVKGNETLFHDVYLLNLDTPPDGSINWVQELKDVIRLEEVCGRKEVENKKDELDFVYKTVTRLLKRASSTGELMENGKTHSTSRNARFLRQLFTTQSNVEAFLMRSFLFDRVKHEYQHQTIRSARGRGDEYQQSAKLHCLYGKPILSTGRTRSRASRTYAYACSKVYDLRQYTTRTRWGPFMNDDTGRVDWEKVEAILITLSHNLVTKRLMSAEFEEIWGNPWAGSWAGSYIGQAKPERTPLELQDPYGITGTWYRIVCFLDYNDFFSFNFPMGDLIQGDAPRQPINVGEAVRLIAMHLNVEKIEPPGPDDGQDLPVVHFRGVSRSIDDSWDDNANSEILGTVRLTKEGEVWWTSFSIFHGQERWRSECIQIGGPKSARGVVGNWFDRDYDAHGPAGPTSFWKVSDDHLRRRSIRHIMPHQFFVAYNSLLEMESESDDEAEYLAAQEEMEQAADSDMELDIDAQVELEFLDDEMNPISEELPGLLLDASMPIEEVLPHTPGSSA